MQNGSQNTEQKSSEKKDEPNDQLVRLGPNLVCNDHYFVHKTSTEVRCRRCPIGYNIGLGTECRDGRIFIHGEKVL